jgi:hypothetical protein
MRVAWMALALLVAVMCLPGPAAAAVRSGSVTDPVEGTAAPGRDLEHVSASYDDSTGGLVATVRFAGPTSPETDAQFKVWFGDTTSCGQTGVVELVGSTGEPAAHVESNLFRAPPAGFPVVSAPPAANWSRSDDGREITLSYTDARFAGLGLTHTRVDVYAPGTSFDFTSDCLWFEGFAFPSALKRISDVKSTKGAVSEIVDVAQANTTVTATLTYAGKTVGSQTVHAADGGQLPVTVAITRRGRKVLQGKGKRPKHKARVTLTTIVAPDAGSPHTVTRRRTVSVTF